MHVIIGKESSKDTDSKPEGICPDSGTEAKNLPNDERQ